MDNLPAEDLPFPYWEVEVNFGNQSSFSLLAVEERTALLDQLILNSQLSPPLWQELVSIAPEHNQHQDHLLQLLTRYQSILDGSRLGFTTATECPIPLLDATPVNLPQYKLSRVEQELVESEVTKMLALGVIEPSISPWNSPILVVPKKDGSLRFCADLRKLNERTVKDVYPIPNLNETVDQLGGNLCYTTLDLKSGYWQIQIPKDDRAKTAFSTKSGHYQWVRAPFGFCNMPSIFQRFMSQLFQKCKSLVLVYLDDIVVFSKCVDDHFSHLQIVFDLLAQANVTLHLKKCHFFSQKFIYLGHLLDATGIRPNPEKVQALQQLAPPQNRLQLMKFLGLINWFKRFIPCLAQFSSCLYPLVSKNSKWMWTPEHQEAFHKLKQSLVNQPMVRFPDFSKTFVLVCDASDYQVGAALLQQHDNQLLPVYFYSHVLDTHQKHYSITEKECLSIVLAVKHFHSYLHGQFFIIRTDHRALVWLYKIKDQFSKLTRWALFLQSYKFVIVYGKGESNILADALSRLQQDKSLPVDDGHQWTSQTLLETSHISNSHLLLCVQRSTDQLHHLLVQDSHTLLINLQTFRNLAQTQTTGPRNENWLNRQVQVLGSWFTKFDKSRRKESFTMTVVDFIEGRTLREDRWKVVLHDTDDDTDKFFFLSFSAMCKYLVPMSSQDPTPATSVLSAHPVVTLPYELPIVDDMITEQQKDASLLFWFKYIQDGTSPTANTPEYKLWMQEKDNVFISANSLLCRYSKLTTSADVRNCIQVLIPTCFRPRVLHWIHGSDINGHLGYNRSLFQLRKHFFGHIWPLTCKITLKAVPAKALKFLFNSLQCNLLIIFLILSRTLQLLLILLVPYRFRNLAIYTFSFFRTPLPSLQNSFHCPTFKQQQWQKQS